jgi:hypothetical protein
MATEKLSRMELQKRAKGVALVCECCFHAVAYVQNGRLVIVSKHGSQIHTNLMTSEDLRALAEMVEESNAVKRPVRVKMAS